MSTASVVDQLGVFFGGPYDTTQRRYGTPQVAGLGAVRRGRPKDSDASEFVLGQQVGTISGAVMFVRVVGGGERRIGFAGPTDGGKKVAHFIHLTIWIRSTASDAEDVDDFTHTLLDAIRARIHGDRTCGSNGLENGGFEVGEDYDGPGSDLIEWDLSDVVTSANLSKQTLTVQFSASEYIQA